jgi:hypothetical protein
MSEVGNLETLRGHFVSVRRQEVAKVLRSKSRSLVAARRLKATQDIIDALAVKPQEVIPGQTESADRWLACEANMRPVPVVAMEPSGQRGISLL